MYWTKSHAAGTCLIFFIKLILILSWLSFGLNLIWSVHIALRVQVYMSNSLLSTVSLSILASHRIGIKVVPGLFARLQLAIIIFEEVGERVKDPSTITLSNWHFISRKAWLLVHFFPLVILVSKIDILVVAIGLLVVFLLYRHIEPHLALLDSFSCDSMLKSTMMWFLDIICVVEGAYRANLLMLLVVWHIIMLTNSRVSQCLGTTTGRWCD